MINKILLLFITTNTIGLFNPALAIAETMKNTQEQNHRIVATVNDIGITESDLQAAYDMIPEHLQRPPYETAYPTLMQKVIDQKLLMTAAKKNGLNEKPDIKKQMDFAANSALENAYIENMLAKNLTDERLKTEYDKRNAERKPIEEAHVRHILVNTEKSSKIVSDRLEKGEDFAKIAEEMSIDSSARQGGDLGYITANSVVKPFAQAAFSIEAGKISPPFKTNFGWHVIKVEDRRIRALPTFEQERYQIYSQLAQELIRKKLEDLRKQANVNILQKTPAGQTKQ